MIQETKDLQKTRRLFILALMLMVVSLLFSVLKNKVATVWAQSRDTAACVPADIENSFPYAYRQSPTILTDSFADVEAFVEYYISVKYNEQIKDYHPDPNDSQSPFKTQQLSIKRQEAVNLSADFERMMNIELLKKSDSLYYEISKSNQGLIFLIDDIIPLSQPRTDTYYVVVRGSFQFVYDKLRVEKSPRSWGYREIYLLVQKLPDIDKKTNPYGLVVTWSYISTIKYEEKQRLSLRNTLYNKRGAQE